MIVGGKETTSYGKSHAFISVHHVEDEFPLLGTNNHFMKFLQNIDKEKEDFLPSIQNEIFEMKKELKFGYKVFHSFEECVFNIEFLGTERRLFVGSDIREVIFLGEVFEDCEIKIYRQFNFHEGKSNN